MSLISRLAHGSLPGTRETRPEHDRDSDSHIANSGQSQSTSSRDMNLENAVEGARDTRPDCLAAGLPQSHMSSEIDAGEATRVHRSPTGKNKMHYCHARLVCTLRSSEQCPTSELFRTSQMRHTLHWFCRGVHEWGCRAMDDRPRSFVRCSSVKGPMPLLPGHCRSHFCGSLRRRLQVRSDTESPSTRNQG